MLVKNPISLFVSFFTLFFFSFFLFVFLSPANAQETTSCFVTSFGNPDNTSSSLPPECTTLAEVPLYDQGDYSGIRYSAGTIATSGCGPTALAMVISYYLGRDVYPPELATLITNRGEVSSSQCSGTCWSAMINVPKVYGLNSKYVSWDEAKEHLRNGEPIINSQGPGFFTSGGHYIVITGVSNDGRTYYINDPNYRERTKTATEAQITASDKAFWLIYK